MNTELIKGVIAIIGLILLLVLFCGLFLRVVRMILQYRSDKNERQLEALLKLVEQGVSVPASFFAMNQTDRATEDLRRGVVLIFFGVGLSAFLFLVSDNAAWSLGLIPIFSGAGFIASAKLSQMGKQDSRE